MKNIFKEKYEFKFTLFGGMRATTKIAKKT